MVLACISIKCVLLFQCLCLCFCIVNFVTSTLCLTITIDFIHPSGRLNLRVCVCVQNGGMDLPSPSRRPRVCRDIRSAEEITEEELNLVAVSVSDKKYDSIYVSIWLYSSYAAA